MTANLNNLLATPTPTPTPPSTVKLVPNQFPTRNAQYRIAIIGEAPGANEELEGRPFVGTSGYLLWQLAAKHGIIREACYVGNVYRQRPPNNILADLKGPELTLGPKQLFTDLTEFKPHLCVLCGNTPLEAITGHGGVTLYRGTLFNALLPTGHTVKCLPVIHPAAVLREYWQKCLLDLDLKLARAEGTTPTLILPQRDIQVSLSTDEILERLYRIRADHLTVAIDIEGYWNSIWCLGIAESPHRAFVINFQGRDEADACLIWRAVAEMLFDTTVPKILQNGLYDTFCLQYGYGIPVRGVVDDTMLMHWEMFCELPKRLSFLSSIYTSPREPYWKDEREDESLATRLTYCGKDCCVTYECRNVMSQRLISGPREHYRFNLDLNEPLLYMEQKGILYDSKKAQIKHHELQAKIHRLQWALDSIAGIDHPTSIAGWINVARDNLCFVRQAHLVTSIDSIVSNSKTTCLQLSLRVAELLRSANNRGGTIDCEAAGELAALTATSLNVESKEQIADYLYRTLGLPIQYKKEHGRKTEKETTDVLALLTLYKKTSSPVLKLILTIRGLRTRCDTLEATADSDGRIRCAYNSVGTETGRLTCYSSPTGSGFNLQTVTKKDRDLFLPDPGYWMFQCDLSGADGWTVAAHCYSSGDATMLEDYLYGLKPAKIIAVAKELGRATLSLDRSRLKDLCRQIDSDGWLYFACKRVYHGTDYGMKENTMSDQILKDSYKYTGEPIYVSPTDCKAIQDLFLIRYPGIHKWHDKIKRQLRATGTLTSANLHRRTFFGRRDDFDTFKQACADEPQNNTTYATNLALLKLWSDPDNRIRVPFVTRSTPGVAPFARRERVDLRIQPLHQVHDALIGQFRKTETEWARQKIRTYFANELKIAGRGIVIPFEGNYGESWGQLKEGTI